MQGFFDHSLITIPVEPVIPAPAPPQAGNPTHEITTSPTSKYFRARRENHCYPHQSWLKKPAQCGQDQWQMEERASNGQTKAIRLANNHT